MPVEVKDGASDRHLFTHLEAIGRSLSGLGPWLELPSDGDSAEHLQQADMRNLVIAGLDAMSAPDSPDCIDFDAGPQILVDMAF